jgi:hypothetical protein
LKAVVELSGPVYFGHAERAQQRLNVTPRLFRATTQDDESIAQKVLLLDVQDGLLSATRLHNWAVETAEVRPGDLVVDVGRGTGTMRRQLADVVAVP